MRSSGRARARGDRTVRAADVPLSARSFLQVAARELELAIFARRIAALTGTFVLSILGLAFAVALFLVDLVTLPQALYAASFVSTAGVLRTWVLSTARPTLSRRARRRVLAPFVAALGRMEASEYAQLHAACQAAEPADDVARTSTAYLCASVVAHRERLPLTPDAREVFSAMLPAFEGPVDELVLTAAAVVRAPSMRRG